MKNKQAVGHIIAILTIAVWGTTYISTKILLEAFSPTEILITRFAMGYAFLWLIHPKIHKVKSKKDELLFAAAGLSGMTLYYLLENVSLMHTSASNVGVIIAAAPFFTAVLIKLAFKNEKSLSVNFVAGFLLAMAGIAMISFNGTKLHLSPKGDFLALLGAFMWGVYSVFIKKIGDGQYNTVFVTRRIFFWGIVTMLPIVLLGDFSPDTKLLLQPKYLFNLIYLGLGASAICFVTWNFAVKTVGAVKTSIYIYLTPVVTIVTSIIVLGETITPISAAGTLIVLIGLFISEGMFGKKQKS